MAAESLSALGHLVATLFLKPRDQMAFFSAYFDESNSAAASVVAGVVVSVGQLPHFEREWKLLLTEFNIEYFHMKEFAHFRGQFSGDAWKDEKRRADFLRRVIGIISRRANISIGMVIDRVGYSEVVAQSRALASFYINEYTAASFMSIMRAGNWADRHCHNEAIAYVFDDGNPKRTDFDRAFHAAKSIPELRERYRLGGLSFDDDKRVVPLQAADFVAYEVCKVHTDLANDKHRLRRSMKELMVRVVGDWRIGSREDLVKLARSANVL